MVVCNQMREDAEAHAREVGEKGLPKEYYHMLGYDG